MARCMAVLVATAVAAGSGLLGCGGDDGHTAADDGAEEITGAPESGPNLCPSCEHAAEGGGGVDFGGDTGDFGGDRVPCDGDAVSRTPVTLEEARAMGFDPDVQLDAAETQVEVSLLWGHSDRGDLEATTATIEVRRTGGATLVDWALDPDPEPPTFRCHDDDYVVPHVEVAIVTDDGRLTGSFESNLGPNHFGDLDPQRVAGGTMMTLIGDASGMGGSLEFDVDPELDTRLTASLQLLFDHPQVAPRAELSLVLDYDDGGGWSGLEGYGARPADNCAVRAVPQDEVGALGLVERAVDQGDDCYIQRGEAEVICCVLRDPDDPDDRPFRDETGDGADDSEGL